MKVIAFNGSPRIAGNTALALEAVLEVLRARGIESRQVQVGAEVVEPCQGCNVCIENADGRCIVETDRVNDWFGEMREADGIIIGSPVYFGDMTAHTKAFIDRTGRLARANDHALRGKVGAAVAVHRRAGALNTLNQINLFFLTSQMVVVGSTYWNMAVGNHRGEVEEDREGMETLRNLGENTAWALERLS
ncbi:MAG: flavodoxin family protein [Methanomassiliicoccales archaeon]